MPEMSTFRLRWSFVVVKLVSILPILILAFHQQKTLIMNKLLSITLLFCAFISKAQTTPILHSKTKTATIIEGNEERQKWLLNQKAKVQDYSISKSPKGKWVRFYTDTDSIKKLLKPGEKLEFRVVIADKDTCRISIESPQIKNYAHLKPVQHDTIPFVLTDYNNIKFKAVLNKRDTLDL